MEDVDDLSPERRRDRLKRYARKAVTVPLSVRTSDLPKRSASAVVMLLVAGLAVWAGGMARDGFFIIVGLACLGEMTRLVLRAAPGALARTIGIGFGALYIGIAVYLLTRIDSLALLALLFGTVICVDTFAYFFGRTIGGPKIAPAISPSKTWAGLFGGAVGAFVALAAFTFLQAWEEPELEPRLGSYLLLIVPGVVLAVVAQAGDFFESWLKRKAGMKDSSNLIPGHGGVFDRIDGLIPVTILVGGVLIAQ